MWSLAVPRRTADSTPTAIPMTSARIVPIATIGIVLVNAVHRLSVTGCWFT